ncbi:MAG: VWA domain-containing protein [Gammaproteobacteria bacterium]|nr:VWA domain-containing protein [Gammaproteobacteria bacterium]
MTKFRHKIWMFALGLLLPGLSSLPASADDTEVLFSAGTKPNVLFILDSSGSMVTHDESGFSRLQRMKDALHSLISTSENMNISMMQFNTDGGTVIYPFSDLNTTVAAHTINGLSRSVIEFTDDAVESSSGSVSSLDKETLPIKDAKTIGLRFNNITIPKDHAITAAHLVLTAKDYHEGTANAEITAQDSANPVKFARVDDNISGRTSTTASVVWNFSTWNLNSQYTSPDITSIITELVTRSDWASGNSMVIKLRHTQGTRKAYAQYDWAGTPPKLVIQTAAITMPERTAGEAILDTIDLIHPAGSTPIVNALYEGVRYLMGETVDIGLSRGDTSSWSKRFARLSHPGSYTNGVPKVVSTCNSYDLNSKTCYAEEILNEGVNSPTYISPISETCQADNNFVILLTDGQATGNNPKETAIESLTGGTCSGSGDNRCGTTIARFIRTGDLRTDITSATNSGKLYTIGFNHTDTWLESLANDNNGGGGYHTASTSAGLLTTFNTIFANILDVNTTFTAAGISVNSFNKLTHNNELYFSLFKPSKQTQWDGNLKRYELNNSGKIVDSAGNLAVNDSTGYFNADSRSFWSTLDDGDEVGNGGVASNLEGTSRKVYTYLGSSRTLSNTSNLVETNNSNLTKAMFGLAADATTAELTELINFTRGLNTAGTNSRLQLFDPLHSIAFTVTYGSDASTAENLVFFGDNQGMLHAIDSSDGKEKWAFIPQELLGKQATLMANGEHTTSGHVYGLDGNITGSVIDGKKYLYVGMRRGGRSYYAFDITSQTEPKLVWQITGGDGNFKELGQSWSKPIKTKVKIGSTIKDVLIFAGGYDEAQDNKLIRSADSMGRAIYIVDAVTGARLWWASGSSIRDASNSFATERLSDMLYSFASDIKVIDLDDDGLADQMYVGDTGGQLWRFDITNGNGASTLIDGLVLADINGDTAATNRRFYHTPDLSMFDDETLAVAIGSGYQAHPLNTTIEDNFYLIKTPMAVPSSYNSLQHSPLNLMNVTSSDDSNDVFTAIDHSVLITKNGWYIELKANQGEKVLAPSRTAENEIWFTTFEPKPQTIACTVVPGLSRLYRVNYFDGSPAYDDTIPDSSAQACSDSGVDCSIDDRSIELKTPSLPTEPVILKIHGKKMIAVGREIQQFGIVDATTIYWTDN